MELLGAMSRPVWGAWIEILTRKSQPKGLSGRAPYGARGLKSSQKLVHGAAVECRAPYGARGLKFDACGHEDTRQASRPVWGAWIEMLMPPPILAP